LLGSGKKKNYAETAESKEEAMVVDEKIAELAKLRAQLDGIMRAASQRNFALCPASVHLSKASRVNRPSAAKTSVKNRG
jgi:hypothetical protein